MPLVVRPLLLSLGALLAAGNLSLAAAIPGGSVVVSQSGDGLSVPSNDGADAAFVVFTPAGAPQSIIPVDRTSLQLQGTVGGRLALSPDGKSLGLPGYLPEFRGSGPLGSRRDSDAPRGFVSLNLGSGAVTSATRIQDLDAESADSVVVDGDRAWISGADNLAFWDGETDVVFQGGDIFNPIQPKGIRAFSGRLFLAALRPGQPGYIADFDGYPKGDGDQPRVLFDVGNPEDLAVSGDRETIYVARSNGVIDVYEKDDGRWQVDRTFQAGPTQLRGVAVNFDGANPIVYAIDSGRLWSVVDQGRDATLRQIAVAPRGRAFLGLAVVSGVSSGAPLLRLTSRPTFTTTAATATLRGTASDPDGIRAVRIKQDGGSYRSAKGLTTWRYRVNLQPGRNVFIVRATDNAGNFSGLVRVQITRQ